MQAFPLVLVCTVACFLCLAMVSELFCWEVFRFPTSSIITVKSDYKSVRTCSRLDHTHNVCMWRAYTCTGRTYDIYIYIYQRNSTVQLTSVGFALPSIIPLTIPSGSIKKQRVPVCKARWNCEGDDEILRGWCCILLIVYTHQLNELWKWSNHSEVNLTR